jgi:type I restriction enzyme S subunit
MPMANNNDKKVLNVPALRFPEFTEEWNYESLDTIAPNITSGRSKPSLGEYNLYGSTGIIGKTATADYSGDMLLVARVGANAGSLQLVNDSCGITDNTLIIKPCKLSSHYLYFYLQHYNLNRLVFGSGQPLITAGMLKKVRIPFGNQLEQKKIENFLCCIDERITTQNKIIEKYESLIQAIIYQKKMDGIHEGNWQKTELSKVLQERTEKNINGYSVCSVSVSQGVINQIEYLGRSFAAKETSHYNVVKYGDIVYTKSPTGDFPYGIVKRSYIKNAVAVSPLYGVYKPINDNIGVFLHFYFMQSNNAFNYLHPLIQKGAKNTINITNDRFLGNSIPFPKAEDEATYIANVLTSIQTKIDIEKSLLRSYEKEKQYLLRQMFI